MNFEIFHVGLNHYLMLGACIFTISICGMILNRKNLISILMSIELMLIAININFIIFSVVLNDILGQIFAIFIMTIAAAEAAIGLAIVVTYYRNTGHIDVENIKEMRG